MDIEVSKNKESMHTMEATNQDRSPIAMEGQPHREEEPLMVFETIDKQPSKIKVIGVGGGGGNTVDHMYKKGIYGVEFYACNTDKNALDKCSVPNKISIGENGAGNKPEKAKAAAEKYRERIAEAIGTDTQMLFITAGMGGGTGTGASPVIAEIARNIDLKSEDVQHILTVAIVTTPFSFEGKPRMKQAEAGIEELRKHVDSLLVISNDRLRSLGNMGVHDAYNKANDVLLTAAKGIAEIITRTGLINVDFNDVYTVMASSGTALMGAGEGTGEDRAMEAVKAASTSVLLDDNDISGSKNVLLYYAYSKEHEITMDELDKTTQYIRDLINDDDANVIWGMGDSDDIKDDSMKITLIATGFQPKRGKEIIPLTEPEYKVLQEPKDNQEIVQIPKDETKESGEKNEVTNKKEEYDNKEKRVFVLDDVNTVEDTPIEAVEMSKEQQPKVEEKTNVANNIEFKVITKPAPTEREYTPIDERKADEPKAETVTIEKEEKKEDAFDKLRKLTQDAFYPHQEQEWNSKTDRIKKMNELLHNNPKAPELIQSMSCEDVKNYDFSINYSSNQETGSQKIGPDGFSSNSDIYAPID